MNLQKVIEDIQQLLDFYDQLIDESKEKIEQLDSEHIPDNVKVDAMKSWIVDKIETAKKIRINKNYGGGKDRDIGPRKSHDFYTPGRGHDSPEVLKKRGGVGGGPPAGGPAPEGPPPS